ncbi:DNA-3-methyladenine glycosylase I, partial [Salmonella enterica subsp. enterica serovar Kentucky]
LAKALKNRGFTFGGTTICYSIRQPCGLFTDHITGCYCQPGEKHDSQIPD